MKGKLYSILALTALIVCAVPSLAASIDRRVIDTTGHAYPQGEEPILIKNIDLIESRVSYGSHVGANYEHVLYVWVRGDLGDRTRAIDVLLTDRTYEPIELNVTTPSRRYGPDPSVGDDYFIYQVRIPAKRYNYDTYRVQTRLNGSYVLSPEFTVHNAPQSCDEPLTE